MSVLSSIGAQLRDPLVLVLLAACVLTVATGDFTDAAVIAFVVVVNTAAGMALHAIPASVEAKRAVGLTMFGVTTACISQIRHLIEDDCECFVFHATGTGGQSFEKLAESRFFDGVFDNR